MRPAKREELRRMRDHRFIGVGRVHREVVAGEVVTVTLTLVDDEETVHLEDGDEFATLLLAFDPFDLPEGA